jgi:protein disulfide-isomerase
MKTKILKLLALSIVPVLSQCAAYAAFANADYGPDDFKAKLAGVGVMSADDGAEEPKPLPPATRIIVPPGNLAVFFLAYDFPEDVKSRLYLHPNFRESILDEDPFGTCGSGLFSGKGTISKVIILGAGGGEPYDAPLLVKSVRITGEIEATEDAPRNKSFFICDAPVDVLFANNEEDGKKAKVLEPSPSPKPDPTLGVVDPAEAAKSSTPRGFTDNLDEALAKAKAEGKLVYACFSGSDWCVWCKKLESEVLSKEEFISGVKDDFVLVFIDTPGNKDVLSAHAKAANKELVKKYKVSGFPTALILDGDGKKVGETGYRKGGAAEYVKHLMEFRAVGGKAFAATPCAVEELEKDWRIQR